MLQDASVSVCQPKVSTASLTEAPHSALNGFAAGVPVITSMPYSKAEQSEDWKRSKAEERKEDVMAEATPISLPARGGDCLAVFKASTEPASNAEACDLRQIKTEQAPNYGTSAAAVSESRSGRVVASVAPCPPVQTKDRMSPWKVPLPSFPPPPPPSQLPLTAAAHGQSSAAACPLPTSVIQPPMSNDQMSVSLSMSQNDSDDSEHEARKRSPSPEPRLVNEECHRSKNAVYVSMRDCLANTSLFLFRWCRLVAATN